MSTRFQRNPNFSLSSPWAQRVHPITGKDKFHAGHDYVARAGTPIPAEQTGKVVYSGFNKGFGNVVIVENRGGTYSVYAHMQGGPGQAQVGQEVFRGMRSAMWVTPV